MKTPGYFLPGSAFHPSLDIEADMSSKMITAKQVALRENQNSTRARIENQRMRFTRTHPGVFLAKGKTIPRPVSARVDFGRWLADCECGGAEYVDPEEPTFFCNSCGNSELNGELRTVIFPSEATMAAIEKTLLARPVEDSRGLDAVEKAMLARPVIPGLVRCWNPGESAGELMNQNRKAGLK